MAEVWAIVNHKGGTTKTVTTEHVASILNDAGYSVCIVDLDTSHNVTNFYIEALPKKTVTLRHTPSYCLRVDSFSTPFRVLFASFSAPSADAAPAHPILSRIAVPDKIGGRRSGTWDSLFEQKGVRLSEILARLISDIYTLICRIKYA